MGASTNFLLSESEAINLTSIQNLVHLLLLLLLLISKLNWLVRHCIVNKIGHKQNVILLTSFQTYSTKFL
jgi:hypothetical protein